MKAGKIIFLIFLILLVAGVSVYFIFFYSTKAPEDFEVGSTLLKTVIRGGGVSPFQVKIENLKDYPRDFNLFFTNLDGLAFLGLDRVELGAGETRFVNVTFANKKDASYGVYIGFLNIASDDSSKRLPIILEVESDDVLFDGNIEVFPTTVKKPGDRISVEIKIFDLSFLGASSVDLTYFVKDFENRVIVMEEETIVVENQITITKPIDLPQTIQEGNYIAGVIINYKNSFGTATNFFNVGGGVAVAGGALNFLDEKFLMIIVIAVFVIFAIVFLIYQRVRARDLLETQKRELRSIAREIKKSKTLPKKSFPRKIGKLRKNLEQKLESLERAKTSRYISEKAYRKGKERILRLIRRL